MVSTAPWSATALTALDGPVEFVTTATLWDRTGTIELETLTLNPGCRLTLDQDWAPYGQGRVVITNPTATLDARLGMRVRIDAGYIYPDGTSDVHALADLTVTDTELDPWTGAASLTVATDEALAMASANAGAVHVQTYGSAEAAIIDLLTRAMYPIVPLINASGFSGSMPPGSTLLTNLTVQPGASWWSSIPPILDAAGGALYCDLDRTWRLVTANDEPVDTDPPIQFQTGYSTPGGPGNNVRTVRSQRISTSRADGYGNVVVLEHNWTPPGGSPQRVIATAEAGGINDVNALGRFVVHVQRDTPIDAATAPAAAATILARTTRRGKTVTTEVTAAWWTRPRQLVSVPGNIGARWLTRVDLDLDGTGAMTLTSRDALGAA